MLIRVTIESYKKKKKKKKKIVLKTDLHSPGWAWTLYVGEGWPGMILLPSPPQDWDIADSHHTRFYIILAIKPIISCMLSKHSSNETASPPQVVLLRSLIVNTPFVLSTLRTEESFWSWSSSFQRVLSWVGQAIFISAWCSCIIN